MVKSKESDQEILSRIEPKIANKHLLAEGLHSMHEYAKIPTAFRKGTIWFIISTSWVLKWQRYVYFDCIDAEEGAVSEEGREHPGEIDCSDIVESGVEKGLGGVS